MEDGPAQQAAPGLLNTAHKAKFFRFAKNFWHFSSVIRSSSLSFTDLMIDMSMFFEYIAGLEPT